MLNLKIYLEFTLCLNFYNALQLTTLNTLHSLYFDLNIIQRNHNKLKFKRNTIFCTKFLLQKIASVFKLIENIIIILCFYCI